MILLDSIYINNSGGKVLLDYLIKTLFESGLNVYYLLDERCKGSYSYLPEEKTFYVKSSLWQRHFFYKKEKENFSKVLCFGNIPPTVKLKIPVYTYFHNVLLLEQPRQYPPIQKIAKKLKGAFIKHHIKNTDYFIVQSENVKSLLMNHYKINGSQCLIIPFYKNILKDKETLTKNNEFVYVSNANPHKNHLNLLMAWEILYNKGFVLPLHLTITETYSDILKLINQYKAKGIPIINHGFTDISVLYNKCRYSIYPSYAESFGLGLIEAIESGTEVIASDLPYVNSIIEPLGKFDPSSPVSIAEAVINSIPLSNENNQPLISRSKISNEISNLISLLK